MTSKYKSSEMQMKEYMLAMNELVGSCTCNYERSQSLNISVNSSPNCKQPPPLSASVKSCNTPILQRRDTIINTNSSQKHQKTNDFVKTPCVKSSLEKQLVIFSDGMGKGMGILLSHYCKGFSVSNHCFPGLSYMDIIKKIIAFKFSQNTTLLIFIGNRGHVDKKSLLQTHAALSNLNVNNIIMFTFPYSNSMPQEENTARYKLNMTLHTLTCNNNFNLHLIDINSYISKYSVLTEDKCYLPKYCKRQIANSLSYFFYISAMNLATKPIAFIEQPTDIDNDLAINLANTIDILPHLN